MSDGQVTVLIHHHCQPPIETAAETWVSCKTFHPDTPIRQVFEECFSADDVRQVEFPKQE